MGIRYYAYPVSPREMSDAHRNPCRYHGDDPLMDAWGPEAERPRMLYLDKCYPCLARAFGIDTPQQRPAAELVRGQVTHVPTGWIPYERALDPAQVARIADDLDASFSAEQRVGPPAVFPMVEIVSGSGPGTRRSSAANSSKQAMASCISSARTHA